MLFYSKSNSTNPLHEQEIEQLPIVSAKKLSPSPTRRVKRNPSQYEAGLEEITKAISNAKCTLDNLTNPSFMENHRKLRGNSLKKKSVSDAYQ